MRLVVLPGVFTPISDTRLLAEHVRRERLPPGATALDLCTGSGALAVALAEGGRAAVTAVDVSRRSLVNTRLNAALNGVRVRAVRSDLFERLGDARFDLIVTNPPYVPGRDPPPQRGLERAWEGGADGRLLLDRVCREAPRRLRSGGALLLVQSSVCGERATLALLEERGLRAHVAGRREGPLGPLLAGRAEHLEGAGVLPPGQRREELLVIRAERPVPRLLHGPAGTAREPLRERFADPASG